MIQLTSFTKDDFSCLISWVDCEETMVQFAGTIFSFPLTNQQLEMYIKDENRNVYKVIDTEKNKTIGHAEIYIKDDKVARLCRIIIGDKKLRGRGSGQQIISRLLEISFSDLAATSAVLNVFDWNIPAIKCYEKVGFVHNKNQARTITVNNKRWTSINMIIDKITWERRNKK